jgi:hypothetical protein
MNNIKPLNVSLENMFKIWMGTPTIVKHDHPHKASSFVLRNKALDILLYTCHDKWYDAPL